MLEEQTETNKVWQASMDASGRVLLPADLRRSIDAGPGDTLMWIMDGHGLHLKSYEDSLADIQSYYKGLSPETDVWSDELIERRRIEAANE